MDFGLSFCLTLPRYGARLRQAERVCLGEIHLAIPFIAKQLITINNEEDTHYPCGSRRRFRFGSGLGYACVGSHGYG